MSIRPPQCLWAEYRGIVQYYLLAGNVCRLHRLRWAIDTSLLKTPYGPRTCFEASVPRSAGRKPLVARFGRISLTRQKAAVLMDRQVTNSHPGKELITRLLKGNASYAGHRMTCECTTSEDSPTSTGRSHLLNGAGSWRRSGARLWWSAPPAPTTRSTQESQPEASRNKSLESPLWGNEAPRSSRTAVPLGSKSRTAERVRGTEA